MNYFLKFIIFFDYFNIFFLKFENFLRYYIRKGKNSFKRSKINCYVYKLFVRLDFMKNVLGVLFERYVDLNFGECYNICCKLKYYDL